MNKIGFNLDKKSQEFYDLTLGRVISILQSFPSYKEAPIVEYCGQFWNADKMGYRDHNHVHTRPEACVWPSLFRGKKNIASN